MANGYFDAYEAARLLGVQPATIRQWVTRGQLAQGRIMGRGRRLVWTKRELLAARDNRNGTTISASRSSVVEATCQCGAPAAVVAGLDGYLMVECRSCSHSFAISAMTEYIHRRQAEPLEVALSSEPEALLGSRAAMLAVDNRPAGPWVYFIRLDRLVKIGTTTNVRRRIGGLTLSAGNLLAVIPGSTDVERDHHKRFASLRAHGEWFYLQDELLGYVKDLQRAHIEALAPRT